MKKLMIASICLLVSAAAQAETVAEREARCEAQGTIVTQAVEHRLKRRSEAKARAAIAEETPAEMQGSVAPLVGYVYTLARRDVKNGKVAESFIEQCAAFDPNG